MIRTLSRKVLLVSIPWRNLANSPTHFDFTPISQTRHFSSIDVAKEKSFTVSYLINSCGLSPESAKFVSKYTQLKNPSNPDSVLDCLKSYGFSDADIKKVIRSFPRVLYLKAETNLKPKIEFFISIGVKDDDLVKLICRTPILLGCSLDKKIVPCYEVFKRVLVDDALVVKSLNRSSWVWKKNLEKDVIPNFHLLRKVGVPKSKIQFFFIQFSCLLGIDNAEFSKRVNRVIAMGFDPSKHAFLQAIKCRPTESTWERKVQVCRDWGWSDSDISFASRKYPSFMHTSVEKFTEVMDFLLNKMGWDPSDVAASPHVFTLSFKNIVQRCAVIRVLMLKGLIGEKELALYTVTISPKKWFLGRFVLMYLEQVPQLLEIFEGKVDLSKLGYGFEEKLDTNLK